MRHSKKSHRRLTPGRLALTLSALLLNLTAQAQTSTATIRGRVDVPDAAGTEVVATERDTGFVTRTRVGADGHYVLNSIKPGAYDIESSAGGQKIGARHVRVQVGQSLVLDLATIDAATSEGAHNAAAALVERRTSEVAANVSQDQIRSLPQGDRNFLSFGALVPGVTVSRQVDQKSFSAAGQPANQTNVFIDGASLKNNILQGGLVGQDGSRGNPFNQEAIQEFRVLVQNHKAEYEQAGTAIVSAVTKSGSNEFHGSVYNYVQTKGMLENEYFAEQRGQDKPDFRREQFGGTFGGPIIEDKLQFFFAYESKIEETRRSVAITNPAYQDQFNQYDGSFNVPFRETAGFGKLSWQPNSDNKVDLSYTRRRDTEVFGFGGTVAYDAHSNRDNQVDNLLLKWQFRGASFVNDVLLDNSRYEYHPHPANPDLISQDFQGVALIGSANFVLDKQQQGTTLRDDVTFNSFDWNGQHVIKTGIKFATIRNELSENSFIVPRYFYDANRPTGFEIPYLVLYAPTDRSVALRDNQTGLYVQDDWDVTSRLQLNLGVRWDVESNANNKAYVTPAAHIAVIDALGISEDYVSNGSSRDPYKGEFQPRVGFSYDVSRDGDQSTTLFGGAGRYYDRTPLDNLAQESLRSQPGFYSIYFSRDGELVDGQPSVIWDPVYLTTQGLQPLLAGASVNNSEIYLLDNEQKSPYSDAFSLGLRQAFGDWNSSLTLSRVLGYRQYTTIWGNRRPTGEFITGLPGGYSTVLLSSTRNTQSYGAFISLDKPYTEDSGWGVGFAYTYQRAHKQGGDTFSLDYVTPDLYPDNNVGDKHRLVMSGIVDLPWHMKLSGLITLGSGIPYDKILSFGYNGGPNGPSDSTGVHLGSGYPQRYSFILPNFWAYRQVDLSVSKDIGFGKNQVVELRADAFNIFNYKNYDCHASYPPEAYGTPSCTTGPTRSFQVSARYSF